VQGAHQSRREILIGAGLLVVAAILMLLGFNAGHASAKVFVAQQTFTMKDANQKTRFTVGCPGKVEPFGGGMITPPPLADGEGIYPHSYERLGVQHGYHVTAVLFDPSAGDTQSHDVTLQVACGKKHSKITPPHTTQFIPAGETRTMTARCPGRRQLMGGGFQRTDFTAAGGDYVADSHATDSKTWSVTVHAFGAFGGEGTAIAYCLRSKKPLIQGVTASATAPPGQYAAATTPACPAGRSLVFGGFGSDPMGSLLLTNGGFDPSGGWTAGGYNKFGTGPATVTAYGYCFNA
jgi:hypothetical protein